MLVHLSLKRYLIWSFCLLVLSSCSSNRVIPIYTSNDVTYFALAVNGIIVPEYTIDAQGKYPTKKDIAWQRYQEREPLIGDQVRVRYAVPNDFLYQTKHIPLSLGLILVSPIVIPILYFSDLLSEHDENREKKTFKETVGHYFSIAIQEPINYDVTLQNEFEIVNIQA